MLAFWGDEHVGHVDGLVHLHQVPQLAQLLLRPHVQVAAAAVETGHPVSVRAVRMADVTEPPN